MPVYLDVVIVLNFAVDFLLLLAADRLCGHPPAIGRAVGAAGLGAVYGGACLLPGFNFLGNLLWRIVSLGLMAVLAFGWSVSGLRRGIVFSLLAMALGGISMGFGKGGLLSVVLAAAAVLLLCKLGFRGRIGSRELVNVELRTEDKHLRLTALKDTGNSLRDPVTGAPVLVVGAEIAHRLTGLTKSQLEKPVESIGLLPGLRLIPYRAVGQSGGFLLALRIPVVKIGNWQGSSLVAFAPDGLSPDGEYQALTGGTV